MNDLFDLSRLNRESNTIALTSKKPKFYAEIDFKLACKYVEEKAAIIKSERRIQLLYNDQTLRDFIVERDKSICFFCGEAGNSVYRLVPKSKGGIKSPKNLVCVCDICQKCSIIDKFKKIDDNKYRIKGAICSLYKTCAICNNDKYHTSFVRNKICKECWKNDLLLKDNDYGQHIPKNEIRKVELMSVTTVINTFNFYKYKKTFVKDVSIIPERKYIYQIYVGDSKRYEWRIISRELGVQLVEEGFCKIAPYYPYIIVNFYSQSYKTLRSQILKRDKFICKYCKKPANTIDHIVSVAKGGLTTPKNCVAACESCNAIKGEY